ncbi:conserved hypothetical protein [Halorhabdus utahensis DSM 12940]|uniref:Uncharacterized protein n=1 Tax=Halorhabdus utahensis (strain DSM 12940 / JCM 11049 / AX-2) TaxID=519442 RepID=C7NR25_HALUD|nr:hypothetical protein [Halorhabdus utahensis]ACV12938.1 conserved hypothetical protein [Halorhabdus utahensis DSM 12940]
MTRYETIIEDGTVYVASDGDRVEVGGVDAVLDLVGGPSWTIAYTSEEKERHPEMDTSDEGLTVDVVDMMAAMTHGEQFVRALETHPVDAPSDDPDAISPRLGLFAGKLLENLDSGLE